MNQMPDTTNRTLPKISVIIPTYNEERYVGQCIQSVRRQNYPADLVEIIVVDNGSTDDTLAICEGSADLVLRHPGIRVGAMRNRGAQTATGQIVAFLDADCIADEDWLRNAATLLAEIMCITGGAHDLPDHPHWIERAWYSQERQGRRATRLIPSGNLIAPRDVFVRLGGFDESLIAGEDAEFCLRAAKVVPVIADDGIRAVHLGNPKTLDRFLARETWHGMGAVGSLAIDWKDKPLLGTLLFMLLTITQFIGLVMLAAMANGTLLLWASLGLLLLVSATVGYRMHNLRSWAAAPALFLLYYLYYLGRSRSIMKLLARSEFSRGSR
jgi:glycosyltransferase involved in cell wall biosynthesis